MSTSTPPPAAASGDSLPAALPTLPGVPLWSDSDPPLDPMADPARAAAATPVAAFAGLVAKPVDGALPTIGHIGRYALKYQLGIGGLGTVFAAHDPLLSRLIAVKTLNVEVADDERESFNAMFINEARAAGGLSHPHIVTVFDAGISDKRAYIAMELLKGRDLRQLRQEGWRATPAQAALIVRRVADALAFAHSKGVIHRDIKPANIFMVGRTQPRVLDFGIARVAHRQEGADAHSGAGSPYYMAPEQVKRELSDRRADVFSLGVVLYELLTDTKPFNGATLEEIREAVLHLEPPLANKLDADGAEGAGGDRRAGDGQGSRAALPLGALVRARAAPVARREPGDRRRGRGRSSSEARDRGAGASASIVGGVAATVVLAASAGALDTALVGAAQRSRRIDVGDGGGPCVGGQRRRPASLAPPALEAEAAMASSVANDAAAVVPDTSPHRRLRPPPPRDPVATSRGSRPRRSPASMSSRAARRTSSLSALAVDASAADAAAGTSRRRDSGADRREGRRRDDCGSRPPPSSHGRPSRRARSPKERKHPRSRASATCATTRRASPPPRRSSRPPTGTVKHRGQPLGAGRGRRHIVGRRAADHRAHARRRQAPDRRAQRRLRALRTRRRSTSPPARA